MRSSSDDHRRFWSAAQVGIATAAGTLTFSTSVLDLTGIAGSLSPEQLRVLVAISSGVVGALLGYLFGKGQRE